MSSARLAVAALLWLPGLVAAQAPTTLLVAGDRLRIRAPGFARAPIEGDYVDVQGSDLLLKTGTGVRRVPVASLTELRQRNGTKRRYAEGAVVGYLLGAVVTGIAIGDEANTPRGDRAVAVGALAGVGVGLAIGHTRKSVRWDPVSPTVVRPVAVPGMLVRLRTASGRPTQGQVVEATPDSIVIRTRSGKRLGMAREAALIEWPMAQKRATLRGMGIGAGVGVAAGLLIGAAAGDDCSPSDWICFDRGTVAVAAGAALGGLGAVIGGVAGSASWRTVWERGPSGPSGPKLAASPIITPRRLGIKLSAQF